MYACDACESSEQFLLLASEEGRSSSSAVFRDIIGLPLQRSSDRDLAVSGFGINEAARRKKERNVANVFTILPTLLT